MSLGFSPKRDPATGTSCHIEMSLVANSENILFKKGITRALISMRGIEGWSVPLCLQIS